jgi:predicted metalloenzyme YecM
MTQEYADIMTQIFVYAEELRAFIDDNALPEEWFAQPDHLAYKCRNAEHFDEVLRDAANDASALSVVQLDGRRLASAELAQAVYVESFGYVEWLEIMQPRPEREGDDVVGLEHMEFYWPDFETVEEILTDRGISYTLESNPKHQWINVVINEIGQELKLNNRPLAEVAEEELEEGNAEVIV